MPPATVEIAPLLGELLDTLSHEQQCLDRFRRLLDEEERAIRTLSQPGMTSATTGKLAVLDELRGHERHRTALVQRLATGWAVEADALTLRTIADRIAGPASDALRVRHRQLTHAIADVRQASDFNGTLVANSLACFRDMIGAAAPKAEAPLYSASGALRTASAADATIMERRG